MGASKALLAWEGTTLVEYAVRELLAAGASQIAVVLGAQAEQVRVALPALDAVIPVVNSAYAEGRSSSIRIGAGAVPQDSAAILIQSVDQPCPAEIMVALYEAAEADGVDVALPLYEERPGHPICLAGRLLPALATVQEETQGLRAIVRGHTSSTRVVRITSDIVHLNLNDPAAYEAAHRAYQQAQSGAGPR
jgi:CTP:molybdopterin cytidylyltransferase MocA